MRAPNFTQIRPSEPALARVERNVTTAFEQLGLLLNSGLTLVDNARGRILPPQLVTAPLTSPVRFVLGKGAQEPSGVVLVALKAEDGTRYSGGCVQWSWSTEQGIGTLSVAALPGDVFPGDYIAHFFMAEG